MKQSQIAKYILLICMLLVGIASAVILYKSIRPSSSGVPYEELSLEEAMEYMEYEEGYVLVDLRVPDIYELDHLDEAICIPYDELVERHAQLLPEKGQMIYLYGSADRITRKAAMKLCQLEYTSVACILGKINQKNGKLIHAPETEA